MNFKRIGRMAICLLLVCVLLFNIVSIEARATGIVETIIAGVSTVNVPVAIAIGATLIALGVCAGSDSASFNNVVSSAESWLGTQVGYVQDGFVKMVRVVDEAGEATYYAACDLFEGLRGWLFDDGVVINNTVASTSPAGLTYGSWTFDEPVRNLEWYSYELQTNGRYRVYYYNVFVCLTPDEQYFTGSKASSSVTTGDLRYYLVFESTNGYYDASKLDDVAAQYAGVAYLPNNPSIQSVWDGYASVSGFTSTALDLELGQISTVPIDGTSAKAWANEYASKGLYVLQGGGSGQDPDDGAEGNNNWKWMLPLSLVTLLDLYAMSQADQWTGKTPTEFDEYTTSEEFDVTPQPDIDGYPAIEITPVVDPDTGGNTGGNTGADVDTDYTTWFQKVVTTLENVWEAITNIPDAIVNGINTMLGNVLEAITNIPDAIVNGIKTILQELFVPDPDFIPNKVAALQAQYSFLEPMQQTGEDLKLFFQNIGSQPPIIWIDLGAGTGWYPMGGKVKFIDLTWYSQYKPTADFIVGGSIWLWLAWRMFKAIPGIISGDSGSVGAPVVAPDISFNTARLPAGRSRRKKDGE